jgi:hypothetical protein
MQQTGIRLMGKTLRVVQDRKLFLCKDLLRLRYAPTDNLWTADGLQIPKKSQKGARENRILNGLLTLNFEAFSANMPIAHGSNSMFFG